MSKRGVNILIMLLSTFASLLITEWGLRALIFSDLELPKLKDPSLYVDVLQENNDVIYPEDYWKLNYLFYRPFEVEMPDELLGWSIGGNTDEWIHGLKQHVEERRPVLFFGDSFAQCVDTTTCFETYLNNDTAFFKSYHFLNFGVGGYGLDQTYLLMKKATAQFENPIVIFSLLTYDLDRSMLAFRDAQKPLFRIKDQELTLSNEPIKEVTHEFMDNNPPNIDSYLYNALKNSKINVFESDTEEYSQSVSDMKELNAMILDSAVDHMRSITDQFIVLLFHPAAEAEDNWRLGFVRNYMETHNVPYLCDVDLRMDDQKFEQYDLFNYSIKNDGHPNSYQNYLVARELKKVVLTKTSKFLGPIDEEFYSDSIFIPKSIYSSFLKKR